MPRTTSAPRSQESSPVSHSPSTSIPVSRTKSSNSTNEVGSCSESLLEKFKEDILEEIRKELQKIKDEITEGKNMHLCINE
ncbi:vasodilator-stimulated phosphoprotein-like isoform X2 [Clupea harengus]|uniref:Vasodilator-stimulated phosphoprotein-like isoform X2 n=1 Tax=Clupea harengus TaxID=7950 RepID=A0A8M1KGQ5_CLUHA|nr:vasodilator-stimulated phosphoprotein-like isoform X2 [Clupea harengus]